MGRSARYVPPKNRIAGGNQFSFTARKCPIHWQFSIFSLLQKKPYTRKAVMFRVIALERIAPTQMMKRQRPYAD
jgi:hypothetical protein